MGKFAAKAAGEYQFTCGMKMYRGAIEVQASGVSNNGKASAHSTNMHHPRSIDVAYLIDSPANRRV